MEGGSFSNCGSRLSAARIPFKMLQQFQGLSLLTSQKLRFVPMSDCQGATVTLSNRFAHSAGPHCIIGAI
eukprot:8997498-Pyramimonas_sp.AAC.1